MNKHNPARVAGIFSILSLVAAFVQLMIGLQYGGVPPETVLFVVLGVIFAALWRTLR